MLLLNEMVVLDVRHIAAMLVNPHYRSLKRIPDNLKVQCYKYIRNQMKQLRDKQEDKNPKPAEPPAKKVKTEKKTFFKIRIWMFERRNE